MLKTNLQKTNINETIRVTRDFLLLYFTKTQVLKTPNPVDSKSPIKRQVPIISLRLCGKLLKCLWKACGISEENFG